MADPIPFTYGEFYDFPRMIRFQFQGNMFFLRSYFDEAEDEYASVYTVYLLPHTSAAEVEADPLYWMELRDAKELGHIAVGRVEFDPTRRKTITREAFAEWLVARGGEIGTQL